MSSREFTGRTRYRAHKRSLGPELLVLQVEERHLVTDMIGGHIDSEWVTLWRDAKIEDITTEWERSEVRLNDGRA